jgi:hypothetical protein
VIRLDACWVGSPPDSTHTSNLDRLTSAPGIEQQSLHSAHTTAARLLFIRIRAAV